ncbi:hypothetical protein RDABS01_029141 [Bienertia sinuspersici]
MHCRRIIFTRPIINLISRTHTLQTYSTTTPSHFLYQPVTPLANNPLTPVNSDHLLRVCTILYQQQDASYSKLQTNLLKTHFSLNHEFFLQVCNKFPLSWRPVYRFYQFTLACPEFTHTPVTFNKMLDVIGKSRNIDLFWELLQEVAKLRIANEKTFRIALKTLATARELKKCVAYFHLMNSHGYGYSLDTLNKVVATLCKEKLVEEAKYVVVKLKDWIKPNQATYKHLICGFCNVGDVVEASQLWNLMVDEGIEADIDTVNTMMERFFKNNQFDQGLKLFQTTRVKRMEEVGLSTYSIVIKWMCKRGKLSQAHVVFEEMQKRNIQADNATLASILYGLVSRNRVQEAFLIMENTKKPDISMYHALIKGFLKSRKAAEATEVFREMIRKERKEGDDPLVNFDSIFVGGLVKAGKVLEATKYTERTLKRGLDVPRFDYNKFLQYYSNEDGVLMFEEVGKKLREVGLFDLADIFLRNNSKHRRLGHWAAIYDPNIHEADDYLGNAVGNIHV